MADTTNIYDFFKSMGETGASTNATNFLNTNINDITQRISSGEDPGKIWNEFRYSPYYQGTQNVGGKTYSTFTPQDQWQQSSYYDPNALPKTKVINSETGIVSEIPTAQLAAYTGAYGGTKRIGGVDTTFGYQVYNNPNVATVELSGKQYQVDPSKVDSFIQQGGRLISAAAAPAPAFTPTILSATQAANYQPTPTVPGTTVTPGGSPIQSSYQGSSIVDFLKSAGQDSSFANRAKLAEQYGIKNYTGTAAQNLQLLGTLRQPSATGVQVGSAQVPGGTTSITPESLKKETSVSLPGASAGVAGTADSLVAGANASIADIMKQLAPAQTDTQIKQQTLLDQMASLVGQDAKKAADQLTAEQSAGIPALRKQFADINGQILTKTAEYNALQTANANKPITMNTIIGNERAILNAKASDIGLLTATAQALQGQIQTAQETVNRAIDLKYSTIENQLNVYKAQLAALEPTLSREEKLQAQAQQVYIDRQEQAIKDSKQSVKDATNLVLDLATKYADAGILLTDSLAVAQQKILKSRIYLDQVRGPVGGGGGGASENDAVSLYSGIMQEVITGGATTPDEVLAGVQAVADASGVNLTVKQLNAIRNKAIQLLSGKQPTTATPTTTTPFITLNKPPEQPAAPPSYVTQPSGTSQSTIAYSLPAELSNNVYNSLFR